MASPQPTDAHIRIAHSITEAIMMRDFSKRQRSILDLILRLSWGCGKKTAIIPRQKDFQVVGIAESKVRSELEWLVDAEVIEWNKDMNIFSFKKDFDKWAVSLVPRYNRKRFDELLHINLTSQNVKNLDDMGRNFPKCRKKLPEMTEVFEDTNPVTEQVVSLPKESIKESNIYTRDFEKFYSLYPRAEEKQRTFKNWKTCLKNHKPETLIQAGINYKDKVTQEKTEKQFIKKSANFLGRDKFYQDYIEREASDASKYADVKT